MGEAWHLCWRGVDASPPLRKYPVVSGSPLFLKRPQQEGTKKMAKMKAQKTVVADFAKAVVKAREAKDLSRRGLAKAAGLTSQTVRNVENGHEPKLYTIYRLETALGSLR